MRTIVKILSVAVAAACAVGMSACGSKDGQDASGPASDTGAPTSQASGGSTDSAVQATGQSTVAGAQEIEPVTFTDEAIGLTQTCDQIIADFKAPSYQKGNDATTIIYLLHCTLDYSGDLSYGNEASGELTLVDDKDEYHYGRAWTLTAIDDDVKAAGMNPVGYDDYGTNHVDGWFAFAVSGSDGKTDPLPEGATTLTYERSAFTNKGTGKAYEAYSTRAKVTIK